jgi:hypothetical protein
VDQLRERLGGELRRYMSPVTLPTVIAQEEESDAALDSPLQAAGTKSEKESLSETEPEP